MQARGDARPARSGASGSRKKLARSPKTGIARLHTAHTSGHSALGAIARASLCRPLAPRDAMRRERPRRRASPNPSTSPPASRQFRQFERQPAHAPCHSLRYLHLLCANVGPTLRASCLPALPILNHICISQSSLLARPTPISIIHLRKRFIQLTPTIIYYFLSI